MASAGAALAYRSAHVMQNWLPYDVTPAQETFLGKFFWHVGAAEQRAAMGMPSVFFPLSH